MKLTQTILYILLMISIITTPVSADSTDTCTIDKIDIHYFYSTGCSHCANVKPLIDKLGNKEQYPDIEIHIHEIHNEADYELFDTACSQFNIDTKGVPLVIIGDTYYQGDTEILEKLENRILENRTEDKHCKLLCEQINTVTIGKEKLKLTWPLILTSGLIDGINPCAFAVLIFLVAALLAVGNRKKMLKIGMVYIITVYITYFIAGFGLLSIIQYAGITRIIFTIAATIAILFGLINIKDYFWYGKGITLKIPENKKTIISKYSKKATIPSAIVLGFLVSMFELPCTGGVYFVIIGLLSSNMTQIAAIPYLLVYNLAFIAPLIAILALIYTGADPKTIDKWRLDERRWMKLAIGLLMIGLGILMLGGYI
ncbi:MAG: cytochrome c biogenesis CcdA family protein [DPANN group archaeon]|nr:cytochrome c biogenesis CcdA family protein [DPANN group archaeon]